MVDSLRSVDLKKTEYIPSTFVIPCSIFDIRFFEVSFIDQTGRFSGQRQRSCETTSTLTPRKVF